MKTPLRATALSTLAQETLVQERGPFASLYLDTRAGFEQGPKEIELRWHDELELVVISGDVRAVNFLRDNLSDAFSPVIYEIEGTQAREVGDITEEVHKAIAAHAAQTTEGVLEEFREERGRRDRAVEGIGQTSRALSETRVATLILAAGAADRPGYVVAEEPTQVATDRRALADLRLGDVLETPMRDALVRSALAAGSAVRVIPTLSREHAPADGVGALLRYTYS